MAFHHRHTCPQNSKHFTAVTSSTEQQSISGSLHITLSGWRIHFKRSLSHSPLYRRYHTVARKVKIPTQITELAMELILVTVERVMFAAVVVLVVLPVLSTRHSTVVASHNPLQNCCTVSTKRHNQYPKAYSKM